jgi:hypothetical protein
MWLSPIEVFVETHMQSDDHKKKVQQFVDNRADQHLWYIGFQPFFLKLLFS